MINGVGIKYQLCLLGVPEYRFVYDKLYMTIE